jgi:hypothetical protein
MKAIKDLQSLQNFIQKNPQHRLFIVNLANKVNLIYNMRNTKADMAMGIHRKLLIDLPIEITLHLNIFYDNNHEQVPVPILKNYLIEIIKTVASDLGDDFKEEDFQDAIFPFGPTTNKDITKAILMK